MVILSHYYNRIASPCIRGNKKHEILLREWSGRKVLFHSTAKREILPVLGLITLAVVGRYSYRALVRMQHEWEEYEEALEEYNAKRGVEKTSGNAMESVFKQGFMGIDLGSSNLRIAYLRKEADEPYSVEDREGSRSTPAFLLRDPGGEPLLGALAKSKRYSKEACNPRDARDAEGVAALLRSAAEHALEKTLGGSATGPLFAVDGGYRVRPVMTYRDHELIPLYQRSMESLAQPPSIALYVEEPVAIYRAAHHFRLFASPSSPSNPLLILDMGASSFTLSLIDGIHESILHTASIPDFGADVLLHRTLASILIRDFFRCSYDELRDTLARQRIHDAVEGALLELTSQSRCSISIPYLSVDGDMKPKHLEMNVARDVLASHIDAFVADHYDEGCLSPSMPHPTDLSSYLTSVLIKTFEDSNINPFQLHAILFVGGAARSPILKKALRNSLERVSGQQFVQDKFIVPSNELVEELCALGAALSGPLDDEK